MPPEVPVVPVRMRAVTGQEAGTMPTVLMKRTAVLQNRLLQPQLLLRQLPAPCMLHRIDRVLLLNGTLCLGLLFLSLRKNHPTKSRLLPCLLQQLQLAPSPPCALLLLCKYHLLPLSPLCLPRRLEAPLRQLLKGVGGKRLSNRWQSLMAAEELGVLAVG